MKLFLCLITPDDELRRFFGREKDTVIPADALKRGQFAQLAPRVLTAVWAPEAAPCSSDLEYFLLRRGRDADACILLLDRAWVHLAVDISNAAFVMQFDAPRSVNAQNFFHQIIARTLRNFAQIYAKFQKGDDAKLLALPLRNFRSSVLIEIARLCREESDQSSLSDDVEQQLRELRKCVRPRRRSNFKAMYAVDEADCFFAYGKERHAQIETGAPHRPSCEISGLFRFGVRLDERRHYNVSQTEGDSTRVEGHFSDCHSVVHTVTNRTHLNMFANDFF